MFAPRIEVSFGFKQGNLIDVQCLAEATDCLGRR